MKAVIKTRPGFGNIEIQDIEKLQVLPGEVRIKIAYSGICGTDLHIYHDTFMNFPPVVLGHEFSGVIDEIGANVEGLSVGDRVTVLPSTAYTCGSCLNCRTGNYMFCESRKGLGYALNGSFTEYINVREDMVYKIPDQTSLKQAALSEPIACAIHAMDELTNIKMGDRVLLTGPGPIGLICLLLLINKGAEVTVIGTEQDQYRLKMAKEIGAFRTVQLKGSSDEFIRQINDQYDVVVECSGAESAINLLIAKLKKKGKMIQVGITGRPIKLNYDQVLFKEIQLFGSVGHNLGTWDRVIEIYKQNNINFEHLITHQFPISQWEEAFKMAESKQVGKILFYYE